MTVTEQPSSGHLVRRGVLEAALVAEREAGGPFRDVGDLAPRASLRDGLEALVKGGACDSFGRPRRDLLWELGLAVRPQAVPGTGEAEAAPARASSRRRRLLACDLTRRERMLADYRHTGMSWERTRASARTCLRGRFRARELHEQPTDGRSRSRG